MRQMKDTHWQKKNVARFNFTYALDGGAWLETKPFITTGPNKTDKNWFSATMIDQILGKGEFARLRSKQGLFTGCWINI